MFYKYIEFICDMNHYMHIYMYIHILHFNGHSLSHYLIISSIFKIDFKIDPYLLFFIEEHLDSFLFSLVQIIPQWPLLSTSYFFSLLPPSFFPSLLPFQYTERSLRIVKQKEGRYLELFSKDCIQYVSLSTHEIFCFFSLSTQTWSHFNYFWTDEHEDVIICCLLLLFVAFSLLRLHIHVS